MPNLIGRTVIQAEQIARQAGVALEIAERTYSATVPQDVVLAQEQPAGKRVKQGRRVGVTVSLGPQMATVPDLVQQTVQAAQLALDGLRLRAVLQEANDEVIKPGSVIRQSPPAGSKLPVDSVVTLVISRGPVQIDMPSLVGRSLPDARRMLDERGLVIAHLRTVASDERDPGTVVDQAPSAGTKIRPGQAVITVTVTVRPGEEGAPPRSPVITAEPQPVETPATGEPPRPTSRPATPAPRTEVTPRTAPSPPGGAAGPSPRPSTSQGGGVVRRTRLQVVVPEGSQAQQVKIVIIDESGVRTVYQAVHGPGDHIDQTVRTQGFGIIQVYVDNRLVQEVRP
jgi:serine/threonine-protein kinase